jgi:hypothetical protein
MVRLTETYLWGHLSLLQVITFLGLHHLANLLLVSSKLVMLATYLPYGSTKYLKEPWSGLLIEMI